MEIKTVAQERLTAQKKQAVEDAQLEQSFRSIAESQLDGKSTAVFDGKTPLKDDSMTSEEELVRFSRQLTHNGLIQRHGALLMFSPVTWEISCASDNVRLLLETETTDFIGKILDDVFDEETVKKLKGAVGSSVLSLRNPVHLVPKRGTISQHNAVGILRTTERGIVMDIEPENYEKNVVTWKRGGEGEILCHRIAVSSFHKLEATQDVASLCSTMAEEMFVITGYDRVMIYYFHEDQHGEVLAARSKPGLESFAGLHWPATDLPQFSRDLLLKNNEPRIIVDASAKPANILMSEEERQLGAVPMTKSGLRSVLGCHGEYLRNMGVAGTLVIPVVLSDTSKESDSAPYLWGLVVCHNSAPHFVPYSVRTALSLLVKVFGTAVDKFQELQAAKTRNKSSAAQAIIVDMLLMSSLMVDMDITDIVKSRMSALVDVLQTPNIYVVSQTQKVVLKMGPNLLKDEQVWDLTDWLLENDKFVEGLATTRSLHEFGYPEAKLIARQVSGVVGVHVQTHHLTTKRSYELVLLWTKPEHKKEIQWAGAADRSENAVDKHAEGGGMGPRNSFATFTKMSECRSSPWFNYQIVCAQDLRSVLTDFADHQEGSLLRADLVHLLQQRRMESVSTLNGLMAELDAVMGKSPIGTIMVDSNLTMERVNSWMLRMLQYSEKDIIGKKFVDILSRNMTALDHSGRSIMDILTKTIREGREDHNVYMSVLKQDQVQADFLIDVVPRRMADGKVNGAVLVMQEMARNVMCHQQEEEKLLENMFLPVFTTNEKLEVIMWNRAMTLMTNIQSQQVLGFCVVKQVFGLKTENVRLVLHEPEMLLALEVAALRVLEGQTDREDVPLTVDTGARLLDLLLSIQKLNKKTGEPPSLIFFVTDVSLRRALEKAESIKLATEAALKTKTQTISFLCHEIRNPLNGIMCSTAFLVQDMHKLDPLHKELLQSIETCGVALRRIVDDVLDMSKIEQGKVDLVMQPFNLLYTIRQSLMQVCTACQEKELILFEHNEGVSYPMLVGDAVRLQQVLSNLLWNAVKYSDKQDGIIRLEAATLKRKGDGRVILTIALEDMGVGIPEDKIEKVFDAFEMSTNAITKFGATGLGLHIARAVCKRMGGALTCTSVLGKGSIFTVRISMELSDAECHLGSLDVSPGDQRIVMRPFGGACWRNSSETRHNPPANVEPEVNHNILHGLRKSSSLESRNNAILANSKLAQVRQSTLFTTELELDAKMKVKVMVVDDEKLNITLLTTLLKRCPMFEVHSELCSRKALQRLKDEGDFKLLITDDTMPNITGCQLVTNLRQFEMDNNWAHLICIAFSAHNYPESRPRFVESGMDGYIQKPMQMKRLPDDLIEFMNVCNKGGPFPLESPSQIHFLSPHRSSDNFYKPASQRASQAGIALEDTHAPRVSSQKAVQQLERELESDQSDVQPTVETENLSNSTASDPSVRSFERDRSLERPKPGDFTDPSESSDDSSQPSEPSAVASLPNLLRVQATKVIAVCSIQVLLNNALRPHQEASVRAMVDVCVFVCAAACAPHYPTNQ